MQETKQVGWANFNLPTFLFVSVVFGVQIGNGLHTLQVVAESICERLILNSVFVAQRIPFANRHAHPRVNDIGKFGMNQFAAELG